MSEWVKFEELPEPSGTDGPQVCRHRGNVIMTREQYETARLAIAQAEAARGLAEAARKAMPLAEQAAKRKAQGDIRLSRLRTALAAWEAVNRG